jgi:hypothetical protein
MLHPSEAGALRSHNPRRLSGSCGGCLITHGSSKKGPLFNNIYQRKLQTVFLRSGAAPRTAGLTSRLTASEAIVAYQLCLGRPSTGVAIKNPASRWGGAAGASSQGCRRNGSALVSFRRQLGPRPVELDGIAAPGRCPERSVALRRSAAKRRSSARSKSARSRTSGFWPLTCCSVLAAASVHVFAISFIRSR